MALQPISVAHGSGGGRPFTPAFNGFFAEAKI
jgi:hypothetical protein